MAAVLNSFTACCTGCYITLETVIKFQKSFVSNLQLLCSRKCIQYLHHQTTQSTQTTPSVFKSLLRVETVWLWITHNHTVQIHKRDCVAITVLTTGLSIIFYHLRSLSKKFWTFYLLFYRISCNFVTLISFEVFLSCIGSPFTIPLWFLKDMLIIIYW